MQWQHTIMPSTDISLKFENGSSSVDENHNFIMGQSKLILPGLYKAIVCYDAFVIINK